MMDLQISETTARSTDVYGSDGSAMVKQKPQNDYPQMESVNDSIEVINIAPTINSQTEICKIEEVHSIKQESYNQWWEFSENYYPPAVKVENDLNVCNDNQYSKLFDGDMPVKAENIQTDDSSIQLMEISGSKYCKDEIINDVTSGICVGKVNQTGDTSSQLMEVYGAINCKDEVSSQVSAGTCVGKVNQTDDISSQLMEVSGAINCKDEISSQVSAGTCVGGANQTQEEHGDANQTQEEHGDATQQQPHYVLKNNDEIQVEGMYIVI